MLIHKIYGNIGQPSLKYSVEEKEIEKLVSSQLQIKMTLMILFDSFQKGI